MMSPPKMTPRLSGELHALALKLARGACPGELTADIVTLAERSGFSFALLEANVRHRFSEIRRDLRRDGEGLQQ